MDGVWTGSGFQMKKTPGKTAEALRLGAEGVGFTSGGPGKRLKQPETGEKVFFFRQKQSERWKKWTLRWKKVSERWEKQSKILRFMLRASP